LRAAAAGTVLGVRRGVCLVRLLGLRGILLRVGFDADGSVAEPGFAPRLIVLGVGHRAAPARASRAAGLGLLVGVLEADRGGTATARSGCRAAPAPAVARAVGFGGSEDLAGLVQQQRPRPGPADLRHADP